MLTIRHRRTAGLALAAAILSASAAAAEPTLADIAACNEEAAARTSASALPAPPGPPPREGAAPLVEGDRALPGPAGAAEKSDPTGSIVTGSPDPLATGMDALRADDPAYRAAYRECLKGRRPTGH